MFEVSNTVKRWVVLTAVTLALLGFGLAMFAVIGPGTLAKRAVKVDASTVDFRIYQTDGLIYASAIERVPLSNGWRTTVLIGLADQVETANPEIVVDDERSRILLCIGNRTVEFDVRTRTFLAPD